jgi:hypothetical protein
MKEGSQSPHEHPGAGLPGHNRVIVRTKASAMPLSRTMIAVPYVSICFLRELDDTASLFTGAYLRQFDIALSELVDWRMSGLGKRYKTNPSYSPELVGMI